MLTKNSNLEYRNVLIYDDSRFELFLEMFDQAEWYSTPEEIKQHGSVWVQSTFDMDPALYSRTDRISVNLSDFVASNNIDIPYRNISFWESHVELSEEANDEKFKNFDDFMSHWEK